VGQPQRSEAGEARRPRQTEGQQEQQTARAEGGKVKMTNNHNLPTDTVEAIEALTPEQLTAIRRNIQSHGYSDEETREAVAQYAADGGEIEDLLS
jgi:hypothetical protein